MFLVSIKAMVTDCLGIVEALLPDARDIFLRSLLLFPQWKARLWKSSKLFKIGPWKMSSSYRFQCLLLHDC